MQGRGPGAVAPEVFRQDGFDPAGSSGLFVGVSRFEDARFPAVPYAVDDAVDLAHLFACELGLVLPERCVLALAGEPAKAKTAERLAQLLAGGATRVGARARDLDHYLRDAASASAPNGLLVAAIASHGLSDQGGDFLIAEDTLADRMVRTGVAVDEVFDDVARAHAPRRLVLLDACRERLSEDTRAVAAPAMAESFAGAISRAEGQAVLMGATFGGYAYDDPKRRNGVFTAAVLDGLRGAAPSDSQGLITVGSLGDFVQEQVLGWVSRHRPDHSQQCRGIGRRIEGPAQSLPLALDPQRSQALEAYRARRTAALARLRDNLGPVLKGEHYDLIASALPEREPAPGTTELLEEIEALDGSARSQRSLWAFLGERPHETSRPEPAPPPPPRPSPAPAEGPRAPVREGRASQAATASGRRVSPWRLVRLIGGGLVAVVAILVFIALWPTWKNQQAPGGTSRQDAPEEPVQKPAVGSEPTNPRAGDAWEDPLGMRFRFIPGGTYTIGSPGGEPGRSINETRHDVTLTRGFWLAETEVTQAQWSRLVAKNPSYFKACGENCPVEQVNWFEAVRFATLMSEKAGLAQCYQLSGCEGTMGTGDYSCKAADLTALDCPGYRLPTEAEWEVAARAGTATATYAERLRIESGKMEPLNEIAWWSGNSEGTTHPVGSRLANPWGLYDMLGNVWEWCADWSGDDPRASPPDYADPSVGSNRVWRGGSWSSGARDVRAAARYWYSPGDRYVDLGFRLARGQGRSSR